MKLTARRPQPQQTSAPTKVADGPALVEDFIWDTDGTRYRVVVIDMGDDEKLVLADPAGEVFTHPRRYFPLSGAGFDDLAQEYVAEKLGMRSASPDTRNLTLLIGYALQRPVLVFGPDGFYERRVPNVEDE
jgi:hypothetical protein